MSKWINRAIIVFQFLYESRIAPFLTIYFWPLWYPFYLWARKNNICFVVNIAEGTGQVLPELDNFFQMRKLHEIDPNKKYVWLRTRNDFSKALIPLYKSQFYFACMSNLLYDMALPAILYFHDITHDAGMAGLHWQLPKQGKWHYPKPWQTYLYTDQKEHVLDLWKQWYERRNKNGTWYPLKEFAGAYLAPDKELQEFLGEDIANIALVHLKTNIMNATAQVTDPETYIPAIKYLIDHGYKPVFVGREKMPEIFNQLPIINYANSSKANFLHDLQLFSLAKVAITGGSGIAWIADTFNTPVLYLNSWHVCMSPWSQKCVYVPTRIKNNTGYYLSFFDQFELYKKTAFSDYGDVFLFTEYTPINASSEDILCGLTELLALCEHDQELSSLQKKFKTIHPSGWAQVSQSRVSNDFLRNNMQIARL
ncbi:MAG TPA: TIGR04372 family glycosyltransferase [Candidatus Andersenbacteria bacterium]|nr:TIGR04372 family glycosyltransferase [Candidatus Andersenbacteria bacterium]